MTGDAATLILGEYGVYMSQLWAARVNRHLPILGFYCMFQQYKLGIHVRKYEEGESVVEGGDEGVNEDKINGVDTVKDVQGGFSDGSGLC